MTIVYLVLLFIAPGLTIKEIPERLKIFDKVKTKHNTIYEDLFIIVTESVLLSVVLVLLYNFNHVDTISSIDELFARLAQFDFLWQYSVWMLGFIIVYMVLKNMVVKPVIRAYKEKRLGRKYNLEYLGKKGETVWQHLMYQENAWKKYRVVSIYHYDELIVSGILWGFNSKKEDGKEFDVIYTYEIGKVLQRDAGKPESEKWLGYVEDTYYDSATGLKIEFYDTEILEKHWDEIITL